MLAFALLNRQWVLVADWPRGRFALASPLMETSAPLILEPVFSPESSHINSLGCTHHFLAHWVYCEQGSEAASGANWLKGEQPQRAPKEVFLAELRSVSNAPGCLCKTGFYVSISRCGAGSEKSVYRPPAFHAKLEPNL